MNVSTVLDVPFIAVGGHTGATTKIPIPEGLRIMEDGEKPVEGCGIFRVLTATDGDKRVVWDSREMRQIHDAKKLFVKLVKEGLVPYKVGVDGKATSEVMDDFDPGAEEVIFLPVQAVHGG